MAKHLSNADLGNLGKLGGRFLERRDVRHFAQSDSRHLTAFPHSEGPKIIFGDGFTSAGPKLVSHLSGQSPRQAYLRLSKPQEHVRNAAEAGSANVRNSDEMEQGSWAKRELFNDLLKWWIGVGPVLRNLAQSDLHLRRMQRFRG